jgi:hypothetical protein
MKRFKHIDLCSRQYGAAADPDTLAETLQHKSEAGLPLGRIERNLDGVEPRVNQNFHVRQRLARPDAAQNCDERQCRRPVRA